MPGGSKLSPNVPGSNARIRLRGVLLGLKPSGIFTELFPHARAIFCLLQFRLWLRVRTSGLSTSGNIGQEICRLSNPSTWQCNITGLRAATLQVTKRRLGQSQAWRPKTASLDATCLMQGCHNLACNSCCKPRLTKDRDTCNSWQQRTSGMQLAHAWQLHNSSRRHCRRAAPHLGTSMYRKPSSRRDFHFPAACLQNQITQLRSPGLHSSVWQGRNLGQHQRCGEVA